MKLGLRHLVLAGACALALAACTKQDAPAAGTAAVTAQAGAPDGVGYVKGKADAPVTLIEYASPTCPACKYFHDDIMQKLEEKYVSTGKVKFVFRPFPIHEPDVPAYVLAMCAGNDKFFTVLDDLFENQEGIVNSAQTGALKPALMTVGQRHGIATEEAFNACMNDKAYRDVLAASVGEAQKHRVSGTPTFVLNGEVKAFEGDFRSFDGMSKQIDALLAANGGK